MIIYEISQNFYQRSVYTDLCSFYNESMENKGMITDYAVHIDSVSFSYRSDDGSGTEMLKPALDGVSIDIPNGSYVAVLGPNGSGKSTLAKIIDLLEIPDKGTVVVLGINSKDEENFWDIRENCSYVFQNPDNQIVGTIVEEDVAFGPENLGVPNPELRERVDQALQYVGLTAYAKREAAHLSGGQKQKLAIAGALAMKPKLLILDESTAMLDPVSRDEFLSIVEKMHKEQGITVVTITHDMTEASRCEYAYIVEKGHVTMQGKPHELFADSEKIRRSGLELPVYAELTSELMRFQRLKITASDLCDQNTAAGRAADAASARISCKSSEIEPEYIKKSPSEKVILSVKDLSYSYGDSKKDKTIENINLDVREGEILAITGHSGCGKTTLISHLNGLIRPQTGTVEVHTSDDEILTTSHPKEIKRIRQNVGVVFQYPEYQLFAETVYQDIEYGLKQMGIEEEKRKDMILTAVRSVGLDESLLDNSPFELSGGQKRRVAMAGVLVMKPRILVLDEPASGLDPKGRKEMFSLIGKLKENGTTIILVSHNMDEAACYADRICYMKSGKLLCIDTPEAVFDSNGNTDIPRPLLHDFSMKVRSEICKKLGGMIDFGPVRRNAREEAKNILREVILYREDHHA